MRGKQAYIVESLNPLVDVLMKKKVEDTAAKRNRRSFERKIRFSAHLKYKEFAYHCERNNLDRVYVAFRNMYKANLLCDEKQCRDIIKILCE